MIPRRLLLSEIRAEFRYVQKQKRTDLYRRRGGTDFISIPLNALIPETYVRSTLRRVGRTLEQIDKFINSCRKDES